VFLKRHVGGIANLAKHKDELIKKGQTFSDYEGMMPDMKKNSLVIDDISHWESEKMIEHFKPAIFCAGIKEKYAVQKMGVPLKQLHSYDYGGPYAGFEGAINFYREIDRMVSASIWSKIKAPWLNEPEIIAKFADADY
jgi:nitrogenase molybdenum-iron protein alpha chain